jgi:hypothetical protein
VSSSPSPRLWLPTVTFPITRLTIQVELDCRRKAVRCWFLRNSHGRTAVGDFGKSRLFEGIGMTPSAYGGKLGKHLNNGRETSEFE